MPKAYVVGLGRSGIAAARLLKRDGWEVTLSDRSDSETLQKAQQELESEGISVKLGHTLTPISNLPNLIVVSPGVPWDIPVLLEARSQGIETIGEIELAWRYLQSSPWVGITGTNGKTTTTALIAAIFQAAGLNAPACGNIGYAACELALQGRGREGGNFQSKIQNPIDWVIAEISSYQIESSSELAPKIGIWTTFTPDHLSRHKTLENYCQIKASLLRRSQQQVFNGDDPYLHNLDLNHWSNAYWTSVKGKTELICEPTKGVYIEDGWVVAFGEPVLPMTSFKMMGEHNQQNLLIAVAAARLAGIEKEAIAHGISTFPGVPHRLEYICTVAGVDFINDSKATNYDAAQVGLASVNAPAILIAGGEAKEGDDTVWIKMIQAKAAAVLLIGDAAPAFAQRLQQSGYEAYEIVETMERAVKRGAELAQKYNASVVLLSPACASFDQYQSFEHRGEHFRQLSKRKS
ncbi:MAG: UDP-N-acetylmuramoyl-L-alanine--D-glutamate ligase [Xenococcaceae cyanobacterium]